MTAPSLDTARTRFWRWLVAGALLAQVAMAQATPTYRLESSFDNGSWFPLERATMEEVVTDSAISQLSSDFDFLLVSTDDPRAGSAQTLRVRSTLIEPAQDIKIVAKSVHRNRTHQAEVVADIDTADYSTIVRSLARAGRTVARKLARKLVQSEDTSDPVSEDHIQTQRLLNQAAQLKREGKYEQSQSALRLILRQKDLPGDLQESVENELYFRLPVYRAEDLLSSYMDLKTPDEAREHSRFIESILRKALERNLQSPDQQNRINQLLDTLYKTRKFKLRSLKGRARRNLSPLRSTLTEYLMVRGHITRKKFMELAERRQLDIEIKEFDFKKKDHEMNALIQTDDGYFFRFRFNGKRQRGVTIKEAEASGNSPD